MPLFQIETLIHAPIERCFDLSRDIDLHMDSMGPSHERAVAGVMHGMIALGDTVTWEATHLGMRQHLTSKITEFDRPHKFVDEMQRGAFHHWHHTHLFETQGDATLMTDKVDYASPLWILGRIVDAVYLENYMRRLLVRRNEHIKKAAEELEFGVKDSVPFAVANGPDPQ